MRDLRERRFGDRYGLCLYVRYRLHVAKKPLAEVAGEVLAVSQFTLYGDVRRGRRPSFDDAARPERARQLYEYFVEQIRTRGLRCETGQFQASMQVELVNQGPVTILIDSQKQF